MRAIFPSIESPFRISAHWGSAFCLEASSKKPIWQVLHLPIAPSQSGTLSHRCAEARPYQVRTRNQGRDLEGQGLCHGQWPVVMMDHHVRFEVGRGNEHEPLKGIAILQLGICSMHVQC